MRESKLKNYIILTKGDQSYLYGKVYNDVRFPNGHLILTTQIIEMPKEKNYAITENQTYYKLENELTREEFIANIQNSHRDKNYTKFLLSPLYN